MKPGISKTLKVGSVPQQRIACIGQCAQVVWKAEAGLSTADLAHEIQRLHGELAYAEIERDNLRRTIAWLTK